MGTNYFEMKGDTYALVKLHLLPKNSDNVIVVVGDIRNVKEVVNKMGWNISYAEVLEDAE